MSAFLGASGVFDLPGKTSPFHVRKWLLISSPNQGRLAVIDSPDSGRMQTGVLDAVIHSVHRDDVVQRELVTT
jgi:hypothetical protein